MNSRRARIVYGAGVTAYIVAVMQRTSLGVAGVSAAEQFHVSAAALSSLAVMQLVVYAAMQVPVGVLIDRLGPRVLLIAGLALITAGQVTLALAPNLGVAVLGRVLVGGGDAAIFVSVLRLVPSWFPPSRAPQLSQWVGNLGQLGQVLSAVPFGFVLRAFGWNAAFLAAAALAALALVIVVLLVSDGPAGEAGRHQAGTWGAAVRELGHSLRRPGTQLGFWSHFVTQSCGTVFSLLWGYPFMVYGLGYPEPFAAGMLLVVVAAGMTAGPLLGVLSARYPYRRSNIVLAIVAAILTVWLAVIVWPGQPPFWLIVVLLVVLGIGGPGSLIGFDFARTFNPARVLGAANGVVNVGGFLASFVMMFLIGAVLDATGTGAGPAAYTLDGFRIAFIVQFAVVLPGVVMLLHTRRRTRRRFMEDEGIQVAPLWVVLSRRWKKRRG